MNPLGQLLSSCLIFLLPFVLVLMLGTGAVSTDSGSLERFKFLAPSTFVDMVVVVEVLDMPDVVRGLIVDSNHMGVELLPGGYLVDV